MNTINRELFEAWLFSQPDEQTFNYLAITPEEDGGCLICRYLKQNHKAEKIRVGGLCYEIDEETLNIPSWLYNLLGSDFLDTRSQKIPFADVKTRYLLLFPNAIVGNNDSPAIADASLNSIAKVTESNLTQS